MRRINLMMLLAVVSSNVMAEWVEIGSSDASTIYADPATIRKTGNMVKMWNLSDFKTTQVFTGNPNPYLSLNAQDEYDCKKKQLRGLALIAYSENMGGGKKVASAHDPQKWNLFPPGTMGEVLWKFACGKQ